VHREERGDLTGAARAINGSLLQQQRHRAQHARVGVLTGL
jgi:hypothetical protein